MSKREGAGGDKALARFRTVRRHGILIAEFLEPGPKLTTAEVRRLTRGLRERTAK